MASGKAEAGIEAPERRLNPVPECRTHAPADEVPTAAAQDTDIAFLSALYTSVLMFGLFRVGRKSSKLPPSFLPAHALPNVGRKELPLSITVNRPLLMG